MATPDIKIVFRSYAESPNCDVEKPRHDPRRVDNGIKRLLETRPAAKDTIEGLAENYASYLKDGTVEVGADNTTRRPCVYLNFNEDARKDLEGIVPTAAYVTVPTGYISSPYEEKPLLQVRHKFG